MEELSETIVKLYLLSFVVLCWVSTISFGAVWHEGDGGQGDAGGLPGTANITTGPGFLNKIIGTLADVTTGADMYEIDISDPSAFLATTVIHGADPLQNPALYLFDINGNGVIGNDNTVTDAQASISDSALTKGLYYILITASGHLPANGKDLIFGDLTNTTNTSTPGSPVQITKYIDSSLTPNPADGGKDYEIDLTGARFAVAPEPSTVGLIGLGLLSVVWRARVRAKR
jgi:hypothetical protein